MSAIQPFTIKRVVYGTVVGLERKQAPWHLRWLHGVMRKMFGKEFTPVKIQARVPGIVWGGIAMEAALGRKRLVPCVISSWAKCAPLRASVARSE